MLVKSWPVSVTELPVAVVKVVPLLEIDSDLTQSDAGAPFALMLGGVRFPSDV